MEARTNVTETQVEALKRDGEGKTQNTNGRSIVTSHIGLWTDVLEPQVLILAIAILVFWKQK